MICTGGSRSIYGLGGLVAQFIGIKLIDLLLAALGMI
jgi:high-affinity K+ transport system ATPase subunit B